MTIMKYWASLLWLFVAWPASAQPMPLLLSYGGYVAGLRVVELQANAGFSAHSYRMVTTYRTVGLAALLVDTEIHSNTYGRFAGFGVLPGQFRVTGHLRGADRTTLIDYDGINPVIHTLQPPNEAERESVPSELVAHSVDTLSAIALLLHRAQDAHHCDGRVRVFDGRRLSEIAARTVGDEILLPDRRSPQSGSALRCDFEGRVLAGFLAGSDRDSQARTQGGSAWLAPFLPGQPPVPVRMEFDLRLLGHLTLFLESTPTRDAGATR